MNVAGASTDRSFGGNDCCTSGITTSSKREGVATCDESNEERRFAIASAATSSLASGLVGSVESISLGELPLLRAGVDALVVVKDERAPERKLPSLPLRDTLPDRRPSYGFVRFLVRSPPASNRPVRLLGVSWRSLLPEAHSASLTVIV